MIVAETLGGPPSNNLHVQRSLMLRLHVKKGRCIITIEKQPFGHTLDQHLNAPVAKWKRGRNRVFWTSAIMSCICVDRCCHISCICVAHLDLCNQCIFHHVAVLSVHRLLHSVLVCWRQSVLQTVVVRRKDRTCHDRHFLFGFISFHCVPESCIKSQFIKCCSAVCASFSLFLSEQFFLDM
ncbi:hypothetical protein PVAP13_J684239 [Panicum virgatum]|nr:hypothetical protein PVAP13_J684239 [Panicum virgatum]